jgi:hypothetical protein
MAPLAQIPDPIPAKLPGSYDQTGSASEPINNFRKGTDVWARHVS